MTVVRLATSVHTSAPVGGAFERVLSTHLDALHGMAIRLSNGHQADAEDLLQDATLRAYAAFASVRDVSAVRAWLFQILVRTNLNRVRSRRRRLEMTASDVGDAEFERALAEWSPPSAVDDEIDEAGVRASVREALDALDAPLRAVVQLVDMEGFLQRDAAGMLRIPEGTVASRLFRARGALRNSLGALRTQRTRRGRSAR